MTITLTTQTSTGAGGNGSGNRRTTIHVASTNDVVVAAVTGFDNTSLHVKINSTNAITPQGFVKSSRAGISMGYLFPDTTGNLPVDGIVDGGNARGLMVCVFSGVDKVSPIAFSTYASYQKGDSTVLTISLSSANYYPVIATLGKSNFTTINGTQIISTATSSNLWSFMATHTTASTVSFGWSGSPNGGTPLVGFSLFSSEISAAYSAFQSILMG